MRREIGEKLTLQPKYAAESIINGNWKRGDDLLCIVIQVSNEYDDDSAEWTLIFHFICPIPLPSNSDAAEKRRSKNEPVRIWTIAIPDLTLRSHVSGVSIRRHEYVIIMGWRATETTHHTQWTKIPSKRTLIVISVVVSSRLPPLSYFDCMQFDYFRGDFKNKYTHRNDMYRISLEWWRTYAHAYFDSLPSDDVNVITNSVERYVRTWAFANVAPCVACSGVCVCALVCSAHPAAVREFSQRANRPLLLPHTFLIVCARARMPRALVSHLS